MNLPMRRETIEDIVVNRNRALTLFEEAYQGLEDALGRFDEARLAVHRASASSHRFEAKGPDVERTFGAILTLPPRDAFKADVRRSTDSQIWRHIVGVTDLESLMDRTAKEQLRRQLGDEPPEVTADNVRATLEGFMDEAGAIFRRGIATCFSGLDRRFRSHDGWKLGDRIVIERCFDEHGYWNHHRGTRDTLIDVERTFLVLDGRTRDADHHGIVDAVDEDRRGAWGPRNSLTTGPFFRARAFKNGNMHLWFTRDDLVEKANRLLAEHYGEAIPKERDEDDRKVDPLAHRSMRTAKGLGWFPTPEAVARRVVDLARIHSADGAMRVLEPSAGEGALARPAVAEGASVDCIEIHPGRAATLRSEGIYARVATGDFMATTPDPTALYDRVVMNPPFDRDLAIEHVAAALKWLKPDGRLVGVLPAGAEFGRTARATAFRALVERLGGRWHDLPEGSFAESGTMINTVLLVVDLRGRSCD